MHADGAFAKEIGSRAGRSAEHLKYGLWLAGQQLSGSQKASKAIHIYSNNLDPSAGGKPKDKCAPQPSDCHFPFSMPLDRCHDVLADITMVLYIVWNVCLQHRLWQSS